MKNETIRTINELAEELITVTDDTLQNILGENENIDITTLSNKEKYCLLVYRELAKALEGKNRHLILDANYEKSGFHNKTEKQLAKGQCNQWLVDYYRVVDDAGDSMIQVYTKRTNYKTGDISFALCTSCAEMNREQLSALEEEMRFAIARDKQGRAKTSYKEDISYYGVGEVVKTVCAVLENTDNAKAAVREEKEKAKAEARAKREAAKAEKAAAKEEKPVTEEAPKTEEKPKTAKKVTKNRAKATKKEPVSA